MLHAVDVIDLWHWQHIVHTVNSTHYMSKLQHSLKGSDDQRWYYLPCVLVPVSGLTLDNFSNESLYSGTFYVIVFGP